MKEYFTEFTQIAFDTVLMHGEKELSIMECGQELFVFFMEAKKNKSTLFFIGNGGSAAIAQHMSVDFLKNGGMNVISLFNCPTITCFGNDYGYGEIFSKQIEMHARKGDLLIAISSSGSSENIIRAINEAKSKECKIITFTGFKPDNKVRSMGDLNVYVPSMDYGIVESIHNMILQYTVDEVKNKNE